jgi:cytochrome oxidase Cu insertion factor (SCO1/SenC/PrrC family)
MLLKSLTALSLLVLLTACAPVAAPTQLPPTDVLPTGALPTSAATDETADDIAAEEAAAPAASVERPAWQTTELVNARTGETFTLADFEGRTVYVEPMATWCTNCRAQMKRAIPVFEQLNGDEYVFVSLSVAENVSDETLASYADEQGFNWIFAVTPPTMLAALTEQFGRAVASPPSTPHFVIEPDGTFSELLTGSESTDALLARLTS